MGRLYVVATPIGNLSDISQRALETLKSVNLIAAEDTRRTLALLSHFEIKTPVVSYHKFNENDRSREIVDKILREGVDVALVSDAGTPCISDPGCALVGMARDMGVEVVGIPGPSAAVTALSVCGFEFARFTFMGFVPRAKKEREAYFETLCVSEVDTFVLYESPNRIIKTLGELSGILPGSRVFVINDMTKFYEKAYRGGISAVAAQLGAAEKSDLGEYTVVLQRHAKKAEGEKEENVLSAEALLVERMVRSGCTLKQAVEEVGKMGPGIGKNDAYRASLNLKKLFSAGE